MGIGHLAVGFAAKRAAPVLPLAVLLLAATLLDVFWSTFILLGIEHARIAPGITAASPLDLYDYPFSHSLIATVLWSAIFGGVVYLLARSRAAAMVAGLCVLSHWVLDVVSHRPDVPVGWRGPFLGLGLWNSLPWSIAVEEAMLAAGLLLYVGATTAKNRGGTWGLALLGIVLAALGAAAYLGPAPPGIKPLAAGNLAGALMVLVAHAVDRQRVPG